jgi:hypothetical protein
MEFRKTFIITEDNIEYKLDADFNCVVSSGYRLSPPEALSEITTIHSFSAIDVHSLKSLQVSEPDERLYEKFCDLALEHYEHEECLIADDDDFEEAFEDEILNKNLFLIEEDEYGICKDI